MQIAKIRRHPERAVPDEAADILTQGLVAHVGYITEGLPKIIPLTYHYDPATPDRLYLHGAPASATQRQLATGTPVCVTVTLAGGLVYSKDAQNHSMNYRSVVCSGQARVIADLEQKAAIFAAMTARYFPGRAVGQDYAAPLSNHLLGTQLVEVIISEWSAKARRGGPLGPNDADPAAPGTCGIVELTDR